MLFIAVGTPMYWTDLTNGNWTFNWWYVFNVWILPGGSWKQSLFRIQNQQLYVTFPMGFLFQMRSQYNALLDIHAFHIAYNVINITTQPVAHWYHLRSSFSESKIQRCILRIAYRIFDNYIKNTLIMSKSDVLIAIPNFTSSRAALLMMTKIDPR